MFKNHMQQTKYMGNCQRMINIIINTLKLVDFFQWIHFQKEIDITNVNFHHFEIVFWAFQK
jgi:hypothetical protein